MANGLCLFYIQKYKRKLIMLNLFYLILLADINLWFGGLALLLIPYYVNLPALHFGATLSTLLLLSTIIFTLTISYFSGFFSLNLVCMSLYFFRYSFYDLLFIYFSFLQLFRLYILNK